ncbi:hypothetical protein MIDIC_310047 [Alphaproteobacteria bacterium]
MVTVYLGVLCSKIGVQKLSKIFGNSSRGNKFWYGYKERVSVGCEIWYKICVLYVSILGD